MRKLMIGNKLISNNKRLFVFVIKFILLVFISYFIIQLSIRAKEREERRGIAGLQTTIELADKYMEKGFWWEWQKLGSDFNYPDARFSSYHQLELSSDIGMLLVESPRRRDDYRINQIDVRKGNHDVWIQIFYETDLNIKVKANYTEYYIEYENGNYIPNPQMEQETGFTTEEIVEQADKMRRAFEEEMERMRQYQIVRARERREKFTAFVFINFLLFSLFYSFLKWISTNQNAGAEPKRWKESLKRILEKIEGKVFKRRYLLLGCGIAFWTYTLMPVIYEFILLPTGEETANKYAAYGISAVITAVALGALWKNHTGEKKNMAGVIIQIIKDIIRFISGCAVTLTVIWLGISIIPRSIAPLGEFYEMNFFADGAAFFIFHLIIAVKKLRTGIDNNKIGAAEQEILSK